MSLPTSITLTDAVAANSIVFESPKLTSKGKVYVANSPQGDILGAPSLRVESERTSKQIERGVAQMMVPLWDATDEAYNYFNTATITLNRHASVDVDVAKNHLRFMASLLLNETALDAFVKSAL